MCLGPARWAGRPRAATVSVKEGFSPSSQNQKTAELGLARLKPRSWGFIWSAELADD